MTEARSPTLEERIAHAEISGDLQHHAHTCDVDKLGAVGMASIKNPMAQILIRAKYSGDTDMRPLMELVLDQTRRLMRKHDWIIGDLALAGLVKSVADYWLDSHCETCDGLGYAPIPGTPHLSGIACPVCLGSTVRPIPHQEADRFKMVLDEVEFRQGMARSSIREKLYGDD